jgi:hypothetical protein
MVSGRCLNIKGTPEGLGEFNAILGGIDNTEDDSVTTTQQYMLRDGLTPRSMSIEQRFERLWCADSITLRIIDTNLAQTLKYRL